MNQVLGQLLPLALGIAISPIPIIAVILMLLTPRARADGLSFLVGWMLGLAVVGGVLLVVADTIGLSDSSGPSTTASVLRLLLGVLLVLGAVRQWRARPAEGSDPVTPRWMNTLETFTPLRAAGLAALLSGVNPKNLMLNLGAMVSVAEAGLPATQQVVAWLFLVLVGSLTIIAPVVVYLVKGSEADRMLGSWKAWLLLHNSAVMTVLLLIFGVVLVGQGWQQLA